MPCYRPQIKFAKAVFTGVCLSTGGVSVSVQRGLCPGGLCPGGSLSRRVSVQRGLCPGALCPGVSVQGGLCHGDPPIQ